MASFNNQYPYPSKQVRKIHITFFAMEDRENISKLIVETLERLAITISSTARLPWEKMDGFMAHSPTKNLKVEHLVAKKLSSCHIPLHFCVLHILQKNLMAWFWKCYLQLRNKFLYEKNLNRQIHNWNAFIAGRSALWNVQWQRFASWLHQISQQILHLVWWIRYARGKRRISEAGDNVPREKIYETWYNLCVHR